MHFCMKDLRELEFSVNSPNKSINPVSFTDSNIYKCWEIPAACEPRGTTTTPSHFLRIKTRLLVCVENGKQ